ncbi:MAG: ABC transporter permease [Prevotella sp.]|nr:ABC transporter permease [Prevotella sp.]
MHSIKAILRVARRECLIMLKHPIYLVCMIFFPLLVAAFFTTLMNEGQPTKMPVGIVDQDNTSMTRKLTRTLDSFQSSKVVAHYTTVDEARQAVQRGEIYAFMYFPKNTTDDLLASRQPKVSFYYSNTSITAGSLLFKDLKTMCTLGSAAVGQATMQAKGFTPQQIMAMLQPIAVDAHTIGNPWMNYNIYLSSMLVPGCLMLFIFLMTPYSFGTEIKFGTSKELIETADNSTFCAIIGKLLPQTLIFLLVMSIAMTYMYGIIHFPAPGGKGTLLFLVFLSVIASQGFSLLIFGLMPSLRLAMSICSLWAVLSFSMVGSAFPVFAMDGPLQLLAWLFPLRHYYIIYQLCIFNSFPLSYVWGHIAMLLLFSMLPWLLVKRIGKALRTYTYMQ